MNFIYELNKTLNNKYDYLKLLKVVYNTSFNFCLVNFIYPEDKPILTDEEKEEIKLAVNQVLKLNCKLECKFNKSYLDKNIVFNAVVDFVKKNYDSISSYFPEVLEYSKNNLCVNLTIKANETLNNYILNNNINEEIKKYLLNNFCGDFIVGVERGQVVFDENLLEERAELMQANYTPPEKIKKYLVSEPMQVFGGEIVPMADYIKNLKGEKFDCMLAGTVSGLIEKEYIPKVNKAKGSDEKRKYYIFKLDDGSGSVSCIHFCTKISQKHFALIEDGVHIICKGNYVKKINGEMQYMIKAISLCKKLEEPEEEIEQEPEITETSEYVYKVAKPEPYIRTVQDNLFSANQDYPDYIKNNVFVVFDVETTGFSPETNDLTEIGAVKIVNGKIVEKFQSLCRPFQSIPQDVVNLTGITDEMVKDMPPSTELIKDFYQFVQDAILVGYNVNFDYSFIQAVGKRANIQFTNEKKDCLVEAKAKVYLKRYKLKDLVTYLGITLDNAHRALYDATATAEAFLALSLM